MLLEASSVSRMRPGISWAVVNMTLGVISRVGRPSQASPSQVESGILRSASTTTEPDTTIRRLADSSVRIRLGLSVETTSTDTWRMTQLTTLTQLGWNAPLQDTFRPLVTACRDRNPPPLLFRVPLRV